MDEGLSRGEEVEAFSRCCVDGPDEAVYVLGAVVAELGFSRLILVNFSTWRCLLSWAGTCQVR